MLLQHLLNDLLLFVFLDHGVLTVHLAHQEVHVALVLSHLIKGHEVERFLIALNVDFEGIKGLFGGSSAFLVEQAHTMLIEEVGHRVLGHLTVVGDTVGLETAGHISSVVVGAVDLALGQMLHAFNQICVTSSQNDAGLRHDGLINKVTVEVLFLTFLKLLLLVFNELVILVILEGLVQEAVLGVFEGTGVTVQDVTAVSASVLDQLLAEEFINDVLGDADGQRREVDLGPLSITWGVTTLRFNVLGHLSALLIALSLDVSPEGILSNLFFIEIRNA